MPYIRKEVRRFIHPDHSDPEQPDYEWYDLRVPLEGDDYRQAVPEGSSPQAWAMIFIGRVLAGWSHPEPATTENVGHLDAGTIGWLSSEIQKASQFRTDDEKKGSGSNSSESTDPETVSTPESSGT